MHEDIYFRVVPSRFGDTAVVWRWSGHSDHEIRIIRVLLPEPGVSGGQLVRRQWSRAYEKHSDEQESVCAMLQSFLAGAKVVFPLDTLDFSGITPFQKTVLRIEYRVPYGKVTTYGHLAEQTGKPGAARAVGNTLARNPFPLIIPCHRAVRSDGSIGGFQGGTDLKRRLLEQEGIVFDITGRIPRRYFL
ncbi:MAG: MGMT family protein [candidate division WOR-3 bacterium]|nr:MAG: MGMT family protein [candidate division WOR-3 bacterium]